MQAFILRGVPGSGKSTYIRDKISKDAVVRSADQFFMVEGQYKFDPSQLGKAHNWCLNEFLWSVQNCKDIIVMDNTNINQFEFAPYYRLAEVYDYDVQIVTIRCDPAIAAARNVHGVPAETVKRMAEALDKTVVPPWWNHLIIEAS